MSRKGGGDNGYAPVFAIDIDGTLGDYHAHFLRFAEGWLGRVMPRSTDINPGLPLHKFMGVSKSTYRSCKLAYRQGGLKRSMPCYDGARELTVELRKAGAEVWICTTRPYLRLDNIDPDTRHWLRRHKLQYDAVLWGENKYRDLLKQVDRSRVVAVMDDLPAMLDQARKLKLQTVVRHQPYNGDYSDAHRVYGLEEAQWALKEMLEEWRESRKW